MPSTPASEAVEIVQADVAVAAGHERAVAERPAAAGQRGIGAADVGAEDERHERGAPPSRARAD